MPWECVNLMAQPSDSSSSSARPLAGQHAIVTGGSRGIGAAIADELARLGADLTLIGRTADTLEQAAGDIYHRHQVAVTPVVADVTDEAAIVAAFESIRERVPQPEILINNAGGATSAPFARLEREQWDTAITLNLTSAYLCTQQIVPAMLDAGYGRIVNIASTAGLTGYRYVTAYCAAKHGLVGLTRALALELARKGITVNAVCPGFTETDMLDQSVQNIVEKTGRSADQARAELAAGNPQGRLIQPQEVAATVGWLCLPTAAAINGQAVSVDGGEVL